MVKTKEKGEIIYDSNGVQIIAKAKSKLLSEKENASINKFYVKVTAILFIATIVSIAVALFFTYKLVLVKHIVVEQNVFNIPRWATIGFSFYSIEYFLLYTIPFAILITIYLLFVKETRHRREKSWQILFLLFLELLIMITPLLDGIGDTLAYFYITIQHVREFNYTTLTGCFYENASSNAYILYVNRSYIHNNTISANLSKCLPFNKV